MNIQSDPTSPKFGTCTPDEYATTQEAHGLESFRILTWLAVIVALLYFNLSPYLPATTTPTADVAGVWRPWSGEGFTDKK